MSESEPHDLPEPFDPLEHLGSLEGDHAEPLENLEGLADEHVEPMFTEHVEPRVRETHVASAASSPPLVPAGKPYKPSSIPTFVTVLGTAAVLIGGAYAMSQMLPAKTETPAAAPASTATAPAPAPAPAPAGDESKALASRVDATAEGLQGLAKRLDELQRQVGSMPKPDLKPIETKLDDLTKKVETAAPGDTKSLEEKVGKATSSLSDYGSKLDAITARTSLIEKSLDDEKATVVALQAKLGEMNAARSAPAPAATATPAATTATPAPAATTAAGNTDADFEKAADLFKKQQYAQAKDAFAKLQQTAGNDARVWYYSAVTNGFATGQWVGETEQMVNKGIALEKAGTPDVAKINAAFAGLTPASVKNWLDAYRARAR